MEGMEELAVGSVAATVVEGSGTNHPVAAEVNSEKPSQVEGVAPTQVSAPAQVLAVVPATGSGVMEGPAKKKRGRPRKYGPDGSLLAPYTGDRPVTAKKRSRGRPMDFLKRSQLGFEMDSLACSAGTHFTPHVISVAAGEDVTMKIISFSQQGPRAICILSANGVISNVTLRQPDSSGGTLTYEGRFELLSLSGSFMPTDNGGTRSRHGGMSVSLASPDGRVVGGCLAGLLVAASSVQVVVGSFIPGYQMEQKIKRPKYETASVAKPTAAVPISTIDTEDVFGDAQAQQQSSTSPKPTLAASASFRGENWSTSLQSAPDARNSMTDINISLPTG
ncbi:AF0104/ALDC/Ptd012-like protein [Dioscorea alata]|uniref:AF0104/ALDC/Ptd012-like protein n=2 Tax=Dioscorea alata TaxID=55571 RepID=A0ACB7UVG4_DIOAL|nr:AF0104/ALDC/Ptd012-like protein [Dioscorea alata]KAH7664720.1 AF0104/ALDC/Ptd012-like protein [Dioscorea alata]